MAQADVVNISDWLRKPVDPQTDGKKAVFAAAFQGMESDLLDIKNMSKVVETLTYHVVLESLRRDDDGEFYTVVSGREANMLEFASRQLGDMIERIEKTYYNVFKLAHGEPIST
jgi:hypothetical protein